MSILIMEISPANFNFFCVFLSGNVDAGNFASLVFLWNPLTIVTCIGSTTTPIDNLMVVLAIYGACSRKEAKALPSLLLFSINFHL